MNLTAHLEPSLDPKRVFIAGAMLVILTLMMAGLSGCGVVEKLSEHVDFAVCYYVEGYGEVCVEYDGKLHFRGDLSPEALASVKAKLAEKGVKIPLETTEGK